MIPHSNKRLSPDRLLSSFDSEDSIVAQLRQHVIVMQKLLILSARQEEEVACA